MDDLDTRRAFERRVIEDPDDDTVRMVFADWLEETGVRTDATRAALIRAGLEIPEYRHRYGAGVGTSGSPQRTVADNIHAVWALIDRTVPAGIYYNCCTKWAGVSRGFLSDLTLPLNEFMRNTKVLFAHHPITCVRLTDAAPMEHAGCWEWERYGSDLAGSFLIPDELFDRLPRPRALKVGPSDWQWIAADHAYADFALSYACVTYGRSLVTPELPAWEPVFIDFGGAAT